MASKVPPPTGYEYFYSRALDFINNETNIKKPLLERQDIANMLAYKGFIHHYFIERGDFSFSIYRQMLNDYRSGDYATKDYSGQEYLRKILPIAISTNEGAFSDFMKFVDNGWFNASTGMFILNENRNHQYIGRAIYRICKRNGISRPDKVFSDLWETPAKTIKEWMRTNQNETITEKIDDIIKSILT